MTVTTPLCVMTTALPSPLPLCATHLPKLLNGGGKVVLLLDIDGTLSEFCADPKKSTISAENLSLLTALQAYLPIWLVTGRPVVEARRMTAPLCLPVIGSHGLECDSVSRAYSLVDVNKAELTEIKAQLRYATASCSLWLIEDKPFGVALHFRKHPILADEAYHIMQGIAAAFSAWQLKAGKLVWEILPQGVDKGRAIGHILTQYYPDYRPIFIGDDVTDEAGFLAAQAHVDSVGKCGIGIKVGDLAAPSQGAPLDQTHAAYYVKDVPAVTALLQVLLYWVEKPY